MTEPHAAIDQYKRPFKADGFDYDTHDHWVSRGHCPYVFPSKAWCNLKPDHVGWHWAPTDKRDTP